MPHKHNGRVENKNKDRESFQNEKCSVLGELSARLKKSSFEDSTSKQRKAEPEESFPPPPPVFQTYAAQLSGRNEEYEAIDINNKKGVASTNKHASAPPVSTKAYLTPKVLNPKEQSRVNKPSSSNQISPEKKNSQEESSSQAKTYSHKKCYSCSKAVITGGGYANGQLYHQDCFKCSHCDIKLEEKFFTKEKRPLCQVCFKVYEKLCELCGKTIITNCVESNGKYYHSDCMKCSNCGETLDGAYFILSGKFLCEKDYKQSKKCCSECGQLIDGLYYTGEDNKILCENDYQKRLGNCKRCGKVLEGNILKLENASYHSACFSCKVCKKNLTGESILLDDSKELYCSQDYDRLFATKCGSCRQPIVPQTGETSAPRLRALDQDFHPECFKCETCGLILEDGCYPVGKKPFCMECYEDRLKKA